RQDEVRENAIRLCEMSKKDGGVQIHLFDDAEAEKVRAVAYDKIKDRWGEWASKLAGVDANKVLEDYVSLIRKHEATSTYQNGWQIFQEACGSESAKLHNWRKRPCVSFAFPHLTGGTSCLHVSWRVSNASCYALASQA